MYKILILSQSAGIIFLAIKDEIDDRYNEYEE